MLKVHLHHLTREVATLTDSVSRVAMMRTLPGLATDASSEGGQVGPETVQPMEGYKNGTRFLGRVAVGLKK